MNNKKIDIGDAIVKGLCELQSQIKTKEADSQVIKATIPEDRVKKQLIKMLTENTGCHLLDSGGFYGRAWQRNREIKDFDKLPIINIIDADEDYMGVSYNIYHYLNNFLDITPVSDKLNVMFNNHMALNDDLSYLALMETFIEKYSDSYQYSNKHNGVEIDNTYNYDNILSQVLQYGIFTYMDDVYILLQIHNGCDVRGGYTKPYIFYLGEDAIDYFIIAQHDVNCMCDKCHKSWYSDDSGYNWYNDNDSNEDLKIISKNGKPIHKECSGNLLVSVMEGC